MEKYTKQFLYLVQSRIELIDNYKDLHSHNSDCVILTFEKKIHKEHCIYLPDSNWPEGRNALVEYAKQLPHTYQYYIFLDDDIEFALGSFRKFEQEVLTVQPDFAIPVYGTSRIVRFYHKLFPFFRYSNIMIWDSCFICLNKDLFFDSRLLPYNGKYLYISGKYYGHHTSRLFFMNLYEYYSNRKLLVINSVIIQNTSHAAQYGNGMNYSLLKKCVYQDNPHYKNNIDSYIPAYPILEFWYNHVHKKIFHTMDHSLPRWHQYGKYFFRYVLYWLSRVVCNIHIAVCLYPQYFIRDMMLHRKILKKPNSSLQTMSKTN